MYKKFGILGSGCDGRARCGIVYVGSDEREAGMLGESAWPFFLVSEREKKSEWARACPSFNTERRITPQLACSIQKLEPCFSSILLTLFFCCFLASVYDNLVLSCFFRVLFL